MCKIGRKIRNYRIDKDYSQKQIAAMIPMNQSNYSKIERDIQEPNLYQLKRISEILNISIDTLLGVKNDYYVEYKKELDNLFSKYFNK